MTQTVRVDRGPTFGWVEEAINADSFVWLSDPEFHIWGDGEHNDTVAINAAFVYAAANGMSVVGASGATYLCGVAGTKTFLNPAGAPITKSYCIQIPDGLRVDFAGATLKATADAVLLSNEHTSVVGDVCSVINVKIDGGDLVPTVPVVWFYGLSTGSFLDQLDGFNFNYILFQFSAFSQVNIGTILAHDGAGQGLVFGGNTSDQGSDCSAALLKSWNIAFYANPSQPGNGLLVGMLRTSLGRVLARNNAGGTKFSANCTDTACLFSEFDGTVLAGESDNGTQNCGTKVQGDDDNNPATRITLGTIVSRNCKGAGLYVRYAPSLQIESYRGYLNAISGLDPDVDLDNAGNWIIEQIISEYAGQSAVSVGSSIARYQIGNVSVLNAGQVVAAGSKVGLNFVGGGSGIIGSLKCYDDQGSSTMSKGLQATSGTETCVIGKYHCNLANPLDIRVAGVEIGETHFSTGLTPISGTVAPAAVATTADVANVNVRAQTGGSFFNQPIVEVIPMNADAVTLGTPRYTIPSNGTLRFTWASAATGTEVYAWKILGYASLGTAFA